MKIEELSKAIEQVNSVKQDFDLSIEDRMSLGLLTELAQQILDAPDELILKLSEDELWSMFAKVKGCKPNKEDCSFKSCHSWAQCENLISALLPYSSTAETLIQTNQELHRQVEELNKQTAEQAKMILDLSVGHADVLEVHFDNKASEAIIKQLQAELKEKGEGK